MAAQRRLDLHHVESLNHLVGGGMEKLLHELFPRDTRHGRIKLESVKWEDPVWMASSDMPRWVRTLEFSLAIDRGASTPVSVSTSVSLDILWPLDERALEDPVPPQSIRLGGQASFMDGRPLAALSQRSYAPGLHIIRNDPAAGGRRLVLVPDAGPRLLIWPRAIARRHHYIATITGQASARYRGTIKGETDFKDDTERNKWKDFESRFGRFVGSDDGPAISHFASGTAEGIKKMLGVAPEESTPSDYWRLLVVLHSNKKPVPDFRHELSNEVLSTKHHGDLLGRLIQESVIAATRQFHTTDQQIVAGRKRQEQGLSDDELARLMARELAKLIESRFSRLHRQLRHGGDGASALLVGDDDRSTLANLERRRTVTRYSAHEITNETRYWLWTRDIHGDERGELCPLQTPESADIGYVRFLALGKESGTAESANDGGDPVEAPVETPAGRFEDISAAVSLIPFLNHNDPARSSIGSKNLKQALPLKGLSAPRVRSGTESAIAEAHGVARVPAGIEATVTATENDRVVAVNAAGEEVVLPFGPPGPTGHTADSRWEVTVKEGDKIGAGQLIAHARDVVVEGETAVLALGTDVLVAYTPWHGMNYEDGIVVSQAVVDRFTSRHLLRIPERFSAKTEIAYPLVDKGARVSVGDELAQVLSLVSTVQTITAPQDGRVERIDVDEEGITIRLRTTPTTTQEIVEQCSAEAERVFPLVKSGSKVKKDQELAQILPMRGTPVRTVTAPEAGEVEDIHEGGKELTIWLRTCRPLAVADKLTNRHGGKGIVSRIVPESEMPWVEMRRDGSEVETRRVEMLLNPIGVIRRLNIGQLLEAHVSLLDHLDPEWQPSGGRRLGPEEREYMARRLHALGAPGGRLQLTCADGSVLDYGGVVVGWQHMIKLDHLVADKRHERWRVLPSPRHRQPAKGSSYEGGHRRRGAQRTGEMEIWALLASGADTFLSETLTERTGWPEGTHATLDAVETHLKVGQVAIDRDSGEIRLVDSRDTEPLPAAWLSQIESPNTFGDNAGRSPNNDALYAATIHGGYDITACACGMELKSGQLCEECHTTAKRRDLPDRSRMRFHIDLPMPVRHPWFGWSQREQVDEETAVPPQPRVEYLPEAQGQTVEGASERDDSLAILRGELRKDGWLVTLAEDYAMIGYEECTETFELAKPPPPNKRLKQLREALKDDTLDYEVKVNTSGQPERLFVLLANRTETPVAEFDLREGKRGEFVQYWRYWTVKPSSDAEEISLWDTGPILRHKTEGLMRLCPDVGPAHRPVAEPPNFKKSVDSSEVQEAVTAAGDDGFEATLGRRLDNGWLVALNKDRAWISTNEGTETFQLAKPPLRDLLRDLRKTLQGGALDLAVHGRSKRAFLLLPDENKPVAEFDLAEGKTGEFVRYWTVEPPIGTHKTAQIELSERGWPVLSCASTGRYTCVPTMDVLPILPPAYRALRFDEFGRHGDAMDRRYMHLVRSREFATNSDGKRYFEKMLRHILGGPRDKAADETIWARLNLKAGLIRRGLRGRNNNAVARNVIAPDTNLGIEQVGLPEATMKELGLRENNVVVVNRAPTLRPSNIVALRARRHEGQHVALHPLMAKQLAGDFDGDEVTLHCPTPKSAADAWDHLRPTAALLSDANGKAIMCPDLDMALGMHLMSLTDKGSKDLEEMFGKPVPRGMTGDDAEDLVSDWYRAMTRNGEPDPAAQIRDLFDMATRASVGWSASLLDLEPLSKPDDRDEHTPKNDLLARLNDGRLPPWLKQARLADVDGGPDGILQLLAKRGEIRPFTEESRPDINDCFLDGLSDDDIFEAAPGALATMADKKLVTPRAGHLTKRLADAMYGVTVTENDCGHAIEARSPLECRVDDGEDGCCAACIGELASGRTVELGERIGLRAAMLIGERCTQMAMKTFHAGGTNKAVAGVVEMLEAAFGDRSKHPEEDMGYIPFSQAALATWDPKASGDARLDGMRRLARETCHKLEEAVNEKLICLVLRRLLSFKDARRPLEAARLTGDALVDASTLGRLATLLDAVGAEGRRATGLQAEQVYGSQT